MPTSSRRIQVDISDFEQLLNDLSVREDRSLANLCKVLISEALAVRFDSRQLELAGVLRSLSGFEAKDLIEVVENACKVLKAKYLNGVDLVPKSIESKSAAADFVKHWNFSKLQNLSGIPLERLQEIAAGDLPNSSEATGLIKAGMSPEKRNRSGGAPQAHHPKRSLSVNIVESSA